MERYAQRVLPKQRRGHIVAKELQTFFVARWKGRPITAIERRDVLDIINECIDRGAPYQAHNLLGHIRALFNWAIATEAYNLEHSPCDRLRPKLLIGERKPRQRVLADAEIKAFWQSTENLGYPYGPLFRLLLLTGARKSEIAAARWREIDLDKQILTVPPERFKSNAPHLVPLTDAALTVLETLPRFADDFLFGAGRDRPPTGFAGAKERLDTAMRAELGEQFQAFRLHDLRRSVRTRLASLKVPDSVAELVIGHGKRGLQRVYDQHAYGDEMREALTLWAERLNVIVMAKPAKVVRLRRKA